MRLMQPNLFRWELPKTGAQFDLLASLDRTTLDMQDAWFQAGAQRAGLEAHTESPLDEPSSLKLPVFDPPMAAANSV
jgi:hypothetical protein